MAVFHRARADLFDLACVKPHQRVRTMRLERPSAARFTDCPLRPENSLKLRQKVLPSWLALTAQEKNTFIFIVACAICSGAEARI
jgi:hypothetical protein